jgi:hypothetical protein
VNTCQVNKRLVLNDASVRAGYWRDDVMVRPMVAARAAILQALAALVAGCQCTCNTSRAANLLLPEYGARDSWAMARRI